MEGIVGVLSSLSGLGRRFRSRKPLADPHVTHLGLRICGYEQLEPRQLMAGDLHLGAVYFEDATGDDAGGDIIQVTFEGGAPGTQLTRIVIDGDKLGDGLTAGDVFSVSYTHLTLPTILLV